MVVQHNLQASNASRVYNLTNSNISKESEKLSSGYKINTSSDDAAGLSISEKMRKQMRGLNRASTNIEDGISLVQVADGALTETHDMLQRMNELCVQAANGTNSDSDRLNIQNEIDELKSEIDRIAKTTSFNGDIFPLNADKTIKEITYIPGVDGRSSINTETITFKNNSIGSVYVNDVLLESGKSLDVSNVIVDDFYTLSKIGQDLDNESIFNVYNDAWICRTSYNSDGLSGLYAGANIIGSGEEANIYSQDSNDFVDGVYRTSFYFNTIDDIQIDNLNYIYSDYDKDGMYRYFTENGSVELCKSGISRYSDDLEGYFESLEEILGTKFLTYDSSYYKQIEFKNIGGSKLDKLFLQSTNETNQGLTVQGVNATTIALGVDLLDITTEDTATEAIDTVGEAISRVSEMRSYFGAVQNRLEHAVKNTDNVVENTTAAESRIRDTDMAGEIVKLSKDKILAQAGEAMLSQANTSQESVMNLLQ